MPAATSVLQGDGLSHGAYDSTEKSGGPEGHCIPEIQPLWNPKSPNPSCANTKTLKEEKSSATSGEFIMTHK